MSPKCFARNLREIVRDPTPPRPCDDGMISRFDDSVLKDDRWRGRGEDRREREGIEMKATLVEEERFNPGKLNAIECKMSVRSWDPWQFLGIGSFAIVQRGWRGEEKEFLPRLDFSRVMNPNDPKKLKGKDWNGYFSFEDKNLFPLGR